MSKANPKAWFTSPIAKISYLLVDKWAQRNEKFRPYFPTWSEARRWMVERECERVRRAERELASAKRALAKIMAMKDPTQGGEE